MSRKLKNANMDLRQTTRGIGELAFVNYKGGGMLMNEENGFCLQSECTDLETRK